jgi:hypothetical protein
VISPNRPSRFSEIFLLNKKIGWENTPKIADFFTCINFFFDAMAYVEI